MKEKHMAVKRAAAPVSKTSIAKKSAPAKAASKAKTPAKGDKMVCETCGLGIIVDEISGVTVYEELVCCGVPMKQKASVVKKAPAAKKATAKK